MENKSLTMALQVVENYDWKVFPVNTINKQPLIKGYNIRQLTIYNQLMIFFQNLIIA